MFALNIMNQEFILYSKYVFVEYSNVRIYKYTCLTNIKIIHELLKNIRLLFHNHVVQSYKLSCLSKRR